MAELLTADLVSLLEAAALGFATPTPSPEPEELFAQAAAEIKRLERESASWSGLAAQRNRNIALIAEERDRLQKALDELRADAVETVQSWGIYASEYFQEKHNLKGDIERLRGGVTRSVTTKWE
jgi:chromosome segregation ATPase